MKVDGAGLSLQYPIAFQSTLLMATSHYTWTRGSLLPFKEAILAYNLATIRTVNVALRDPNLWNRGEYCCGGNLAAAETHLVGLVSLLNARLMEGRVRLEGSGVDGDEELTDRCVILFAAFMGCIYSRVKFYHENPAVIEVLDHCHERDVNGFPTRLAIFRSIPAFFILPATSSSLQQPVDVSRLLDSIRQMTRESDVIRSSEDDSTDTVDKVWRRGTATYLCIEAIKVHTSSYVYSGRNRAGSSPVRSTLSGMLAAKMLYLGTVLGMLDLGWKPLTLLVPHVLRVIVRDLRQGGGDKYRDLWLWKAFLACITLSAFPGCLEVEMEVFLHKSIQSWSQTAGIREWEDAKQVLGRIVWPDVVDQDGRFDDLWEHIITD
ncbi:uncharacterized protein DNG_09495 [Cephalotrichum gorgonifer]|uniref:Uncharacterized protein n=1 Tax=Cephalotrichum gorgonifer TaxID=2041049 RepID=A0AAE8N5U4_9PEZI|nr:uncharacterized protein DNG_09495 [Cephalotrichum gorgonifer]